MMHPWLWMCERGLDALLLPRLRGRSKFAERRRALGDAGERRAYFYLRRAGYVIVARQWRAPNLDGEIDLIGWQGDTLCFVEVKTRGRRDRFAPGFAVNADKRKAIRRMARAYVRGLFNEGDTLPAMRADVVTVSRVGRSWHVAMQQDAFSLLAES